MGGAGAVLQALNHPDTWAAAMSVSGALHRPLAENDPRRSWIPGLYHNVFGTPFDKARFNAANAFNRMNRLTAAKQKPAFYFTIGDNDYADLIEASAEFHDDLREIGVDTTLRIGSGRHFWETWQQAIVPALEWAVPHLDATCGRGRR